MQIKTNIRSVTKKASALVLLLAMLVSNLSLDVTMAYAKNKQENAPAKQESVPTPASAPVPTAPAPETAKPEAVKQEKKNPTTPKADNPKKGDKQQKHRVKKDRALKDSFSGKKLERIQGSLRENKNYKLLIQTSDSPEAINSFFNTQERQIRVKQVSPTSYLVRIPRNNPQFATELSKMDAGLIPTTLGIYDVVQPDVFESFGTEGYLDGESLGNLWNMQTVGVPSFAEDLATKQKTKVGVLDTGVDGAHPDLSANYDSALSYDFIANTNGGNDDNGHGTEVAGIIGASVNGAGVFGSNPSADIVSLKVLDQNGLGTTYDILEAISYASANHIPVLNMSFGTNGNPNNNPICDAISEARRNGTVTVVSAGNKNISATGVIPAACPDAITVGSTLQDSRKAPFSNYGPLVDVYAPGINIYTTMKGGGYGSFSGTSFSAPLVSGLVAKEMAFNPSITMEGVETAIKNSYQLTSTGYAETIIPLYAGSGSTNSGVILQEAQAFTGSMPEPTFSEPPMDAGKFAANSMQYAGISSNWASDCSRQDVATFSNGYSLKHYALAGGFTRYVGRTELYLNDVLQSYQDTVFYSNGGAPAFNGNSCYLMSMFNNVTLSDDGTIDIKYNFWNGFGWAWDTAPTKFNINKKYLSNLEITATAFGEPNHFYIKFNGYDNSASSTVPIASQGYFDNHWSWIYARSGDWLWGGQSFWTSGCTITNVADDTVDYLVSYSCSLSVSTGWGAANWPGSTSTEIEYGTFHLAKSDYNICQYDSRYCSAEDLVKYWVFSSPTLGNMEVLQAGAKRTPFSIGMEAETNFIWALNRYPSDYKSWYESLGVNTNVIIGTDPKYLIDWNSGEYVPKTAFQNGSRFNASEGWMISTRKVTSSPADLQDMYWQLNLQNPYFTSTNNEWTAYGGDGLALYPIKSKEDGSAVAYIQFPSGNLICKSSSCIDVGGSEKFLDSNSGLWQITPDGNYYVYWNGNDDYKTYIRGMTESPSWFWRKLMDVRGWWQISPDGLYYVYMNNDDMKTYKKLLSDTSTSPGEKLADNNAAPIFTADGQYLIYMNPNDGMKMYMKAINDSSGGDGTKLMDTNAWGRLSPDRTFLIYNNQNDEWKLYRKYLSEGAASTGTKFLDGNGGWNFTPDGQYFIYQNPNDNWKVYKKATNEEWYADGTKFLDVSAGWQFTQDWLYYIYQNPNDSNKIYKKAVSDDSGSLGAKFIDSGGWGQFTPDGKYYIYQNQSAGYKIYKKLLNDTSASFGTKLLDVNSGIKITPDSKYLIYQNSNDGYKLYKKSIERQSVTVIPVQNTSEAIPNIGTIVLSELSRYLGSKAQTVKNNAVYIYDTTASTATSIKNAVKSTAIDASDPVNLATGEFDYSNTFMQIPGQGMSYEFSLDYRNRPSYDGPVGNKFDHNYNIFLAESTGSVNFFNGKLGIFNFAESGSTYEYDRGLKANLSKDATSGLYSLTYDEGTVYHFGTNLKIADITDRYQNTMSFAYNDDRQLTTVTDTLGHVITYSYGADSRLTKVTDQNGRNVVLLYYGFGDPLGKPGDLKSVGINAEASSKKISFTYDANHNIKTLVDSKGQVYVTNVYDENDRVASQVYGADTVNYQYTLSGSAVASNLVTNPNGIQTKYTYDNNGNTTKREIYATNGGVAAVFEYEYDTNARLAKSILPRGNGTTYRYDDRGNIIEKREKADIQAEDAPSDLVTTYEYDTRYSLPIKSVLPNGLETNYTLDDAGHVLAQTATGITRVDGSAYSVTNSYTYSTGGLLASKTDGEGSVTSYAYTGGQLTDLIHGSGADAIAESFTYDIYGNLTVSTDGEGKSKHFSYTPFNLTASGVTAEGIETRFTYDANNNKIREESVNQSGAIVGAVDYEYDLRDRLIRKTERIDATRTRVTTMGYDANGNVATMREGTGAIVTYLYDELNRAREKRIVVDSNDHTQDLVTVYLYDKNGNAVMVTDPMGGVTTSEYNLHDWMTKQTDANGNYTTYAYDKMGHVVEVKSYDAANQLLQKSSSQYDQLGHVIRSVRHDLDHETAQDTVITTNYDRNGKAIDQTDAKGNVSRSTYDQFGRALGTTDALGNASSVIYDKRSLPTSKSLTSSGSSYAITTTLAYDDDGRLVSETDANGKQKHYSYDTLGRIVAMKDENDNVTTRNYDSLGNVLSETKTLSGATNTAVTTAYSYDTHGNLLSVTDANGNVTSYQYDMLNRKIRETLADGSFTIYGYDKLGNLSQMTDPNGTVTTYGYDTLHRLNSKSMALASGVKGTTLESYSYDVLGRMASVTASGGTMSTVSFAYDSQSRLLSETQSHDGTGSVTVNYAYDANGNRTSVSSGSGYVVEYSYDAINRMTGVGYNSQNIANYTYSGSLLDHVDRGNGTSTSYAYDSLLRLSNLSHVTASGASIATRSYAYDPAGNLLGDGQRNYAYDSLYRLTSAETLSGSVFASPVESFSYDPAGNRALSENSVQSKAYAVNELNQYVTASGSTAPRAYDRNGNLTANGAYSFSYDYRNRLLEVKKLIAGNTVTVATYSYDALGRRIGKTASDRSSSYAYAGDNAILEAVSDSNLSAPVTTARIYGNGADALLAYETDDTMLPDSDAPEHAFCEERVLPYAADFSKYGHNAITERCDTLRTTFRTTERKLFYVHSDHLSSTVALTDASGATVMEYAYDAYGTPYAKVGGELFPIASYRGSLHGNDRLFTGREYETSTNLYYYRARFYDPNDGRFLQRDPVGMADQVNLYAYVGNSPGMYADPTGMMTKIMAANATRETSETYQVILKGNLGKPSERSIYMQTATLTDSEYKLYDGFSLYSLWNVSNNKDSAYNNPEYLAALDAVKQDPLYQKFQGKDMMQKYGWDAWNNTYADALRHTYFNALNGRDFDADTARAIGDRHEMMDGNTWHTAVMDLYNNSIGRSIWSANKGKTDEEILKLVVENKDNLIYWYGQSDGYWKWNENYQRVAKSLKIQ